MARVELASQGWGWVTDTAGNAQPSVTATLKNLDGTNATTWSAVTGGSSSTAALTTNSDGTLPRFVEQGSYTLTVGATTRSVEASPGGAPQTLDAGVATTTNLTLLRNDASNTNALIVQNMTTGGRVGVTYRDENSNDLARAQAHNAADPGSSTSQYVIYTRRVTPRLDGNMMEARWLIESETDFGVASVYGATLQVNTHDTDGALNETQTGFKAFRSPTDSANESTELLRARTSSVGSNLFSRNLTSADTAGPLVRILNDNAGDDQAALRVTQDCSQAAIDVENTTGGPAVFVRQGYIDLLEMSDPAGPATDRARLYVKDTGSGRTVASLRTTSDIVNLYGSLIGSTTWDPASLANGASERKSVTVTGAAVGDMASAGLTTIAATGWDIQAAVIATNTVEVKITNNTGGVVDLGSGTVRAAVRKVA